MTTGSAPQQCLGVKSRLHSEAPRGKQNFCGSAATLQSICSHSTATLRSLYSHSIVLVFLLKTSSSSQIESLVKRTSIWISRWIKEKILQQLTLNCSKSYETLERRETYLEFIMFNTICLVFTVFYLIGPGTFCTDLTHSIYTKFL